MTVTVPLTEKTGAKDIQAKITSLSAVATTAPHYNQSQQLLVQAQIELVNALLSQQKLNAATILSTYTGTRNPLAAAIAKTTALVASYGNTLPGLAAAQTLVQQQNAAVNELMVNREISAASILSSQTYIGQPAQ